MSIFSRLLPILLVLALLPWGSFAPRFGTPVSQIPAHSARLDAAQQASDTGIAALTPDKTYASAAKRCKAPALPGSPCDPVLAVLPAETTLVFASAYSALYTEALHRLIGQSPPLSLGPPRQS